MAAIYIHIPFCSSKCTYCDFLSYPDRDHLIPSYITALLTEIRVRGQTSRLVKSIYIGGGTPSLLSSAQIATIIESCEENHCITPGSEVTLEANPGTITQAGLNGWRGCGFNRLSIGAQSFDDTTLALLGRVHTAEEISYSFSLARRAGFQNINLDLIFAVPGQSRMSWTRDLEQALALTPDHISVYNLTIEEGTELYRQWREGEIEKMSSDEELDMYDLAVSRLVGAGYEHYEVSNFCLPGKRCHHNEAYWHNEEYLGFGASAFTYLNRCRSNNHFDLKRYIDEVERFGDATEHREPIDAETEMVETAIQELRLLEGVDLQRFRRRFGLDFNQVFAGVLPELKAEGLLEESPRGIRLSPRGVRLGNEVAMRFLP